MAQQTPPTKEQVRLYLESRQTQQCPPPSMAEIRRQLGWEMMQMPASDAGRDGRE
ncbi:MAG: hypothetical protein V4724_28935 [Pseudomonadota bacterium]